MLHATRATRRSSAFLFATATLSGAAWFFAACSGTDIPTIENDGGSQADTGRGTPPPDPVDSGRGPRDGAAETGPGDAAPDAEPNPEECAELRLRVEQLRPAASACSALNPRMQCREVVEDLCCFLTVTDAKSEAVSAFTGAVSSFQKKNCRIACPKVECVEEPSEACMLRPVGSSCRQQPGLGEGT